MSPHTWALDSGTQAVLSTLQLWSDLLVDPGQLIVQLVPFVKEFMQCTHLLVVYMIIHAVHYFFFYPFH